MKRELPIVDDWFTIDPVDEYGIQWIREPYVHDYGCGSIWLVNGRERNLLVETGSGVAPLRAFLETTTDKPIIAFASVGYYDHAGGLSQFDERLIQEAEAFRVMHPTRHNTVSDYYMPQSFTARPNSEFDPQTYVQPSTEPTRLLKDGDFIDLGDRKFEVIHLPGVTKGASALFERETGALFTGEAFVWSIRGVYDGEPEDRSDDADREDFKNSIKRLAALPVNAVYPGHRGRSDAKTMHDVIEAYLNSNL